MAPNGDQEVEPHRSIKHHLIALPSPDLVVEILRQLQASVYVPLKPLCSLAEKKREKESELLRWVCVRSGTDQGQMRDRGETDEGQMRDTSGTDQGQMRDR